MISTIRFISAGNFLRNLVTLLIPFSSDRYLSSYYRRAEAIALNKGQTKFNQIRVIIVLNVLCAIYYVKLYWFPGSTEWSSLSQFDYFHFEGVPKLFNFLSIFLMADKAYCFHVLYFKFFQTKSAKIIRDNFVWKCDQRFVLNTKRPFTSDWHRYILNSFRMAIFLHKVFWVVEYFRIATIMLKMERWPQSLISIGLGLLGMNLCWVLLMINFVNYFYICYLWVTLILAGCSLYSERFRQMNALLDAPETKHRNRQQAKLKHRLRRYQKLHQGSLQFLFSFGPIFSSIFFTFLLSNCPFNIAILSLWTMGQMPFALKIGLGAAACGELFVILFVHVLVINFSKQTHFPAKRLMSLNARFISQSTVSTRFRLTLSYFIQSIHTKKRYGMTYGIFGLVSMAAFVKFFLLYAKFLMSVYYRMSAN